MRYWWVNQNQTYRQEVKGGYLWSPKRNANGARNPFYEFMREVAPGDLVFSFVDTRNCGHWDGCVLLLREPQACGIRRNRLELGGNRMARTREFRGAAEQDSSKRSHRCAEKSTALPLFPIAGNRKRNSVCLSDRIAISVRRSSDRADGPRSHNATKQVISLSR